ncbi:MAG: TfoX/Sxy family protein [Roseivivax sp.]|nr:TfoX/Sxy family protein [Roseivivax sp.]
MAYDAGMAETMRQDLDGIDAVREVPMFGGLCFLKDGHMLCGVHKGGAMYRVGKPRSAEALSLGDARVMAMTGRAMPAIVDIAPEGFADDARRARWLALALENVAGLPPKPA